MKEQFIPYELAIELRNLGFDDYVFAFYWTDTKQLIFDNPDYLGKHNGVHLQAPLWQQAFDWFREKYNVYCAITSSTMMIDWTYYIFEALNSKPLDNPILEGWSYEEARLECLKKIIELCKNVK